MKRIFSKIFILFVLTSVVFSTLSVLAANTVKMQMFFSPGMLDVTSGELSVDVNTWNYSKVKHESLGSICGITFAFDYSLEGFKLKVDEEGNPAVFLDENTLVKSESDLSVREIAPGRVLVTYLDESLKNGLINSDGTVLRFTLISNAPTAFWNSVTTYPIRFVPGSIGFVMFHEQNGVRRLYDVEGIDNVIGAYNLPPSLIPPTVGKTISFTVGESAVTVDGQKTEMDATPYVLENEIMVPIRFLAENLNMEVIWDSDSSSVAAFTQYKSLLLSVSDGKVYINSAYLYLVPAPQLVGDRVYVPASLVSALYPKATVSVSDNVVSFMVP